MPGVIVDTDVAIDFLRGESYVQPLLAGLWRAGTAVLSALTVYELTAGMREKERLQTMAFIDACTIELVTRKIAERGGGIYRNWRSQGVTLTAIDCLIAATAQERDFVIATRNIKHYPDKNLLYRF
jgi:hypothetical protein